MKSADVGMVQGGNLASFALHRLFQLRIGREISRCNFDSNIATKARIASAIYLSHPPGAQGFLNLVRSELCARG
jgi:hypothetical protein